MEIHFQENPSSLHAEFIARQFFGYFSSEYDFDERLYEILKSNCISLFNRYDLSKCGLWILKDGSEFKGSIIIDGGQKDDANRAQLRLFCLTDDIRGYGWGNQLLNHSIEFAKQRGFSGLFLWTLNGLEPAGHMYRKAGFNSEEVKIGTQWGIEAPEERFVLNF